MKNLWGMLAIVMLWVTWTAAQQKYAFGPVDVNGQPMGATTGRVIMLVSGTCPTGFTEMTALDGAMPLGTLAAHGDVGTTGGSNTVTPTVASLSAAAQAFTGDATAIPAEVISYPANVPTISGTTINSFSSVINHTHTFTATSTSRVQGGTTASTSGTHVMTSTATGGSARAPTAGDAITGTSDNPSGGVASITPTINNPGAIAWPANPPTNASTTATPMGHNTASAVTGTLNSFDNRPAWVKVIFCQKT